MEQIIKKLLPKNVSPEIFGNIAAFEVSSNEITAVCKNLYFEQKLPLKTITAIDEGNNNFKVMYVFGIPNENIFLTPYLQLNDSTTFPSLVNEIHEASSYERKIKTFFGLSPEGHINPRPIILHEDWPEKEYPLRKNFKWDRRPEEANNSYEFTKVDGEGIYEIPVGPVHAGIIEPGHFRFSVAGEEIILLEPKLGYTHKGTEKLFETLPLDKKVKLSERVSGDSSFSHSLAFCQAAEILAGIDIPEKANWLRVIFAELERLANHFGDIGFIMLDAGYSFGGSNGQRLREKIMQWNEKLTGSRFLRGVNTIGGVTKNIPSENKSELEKDLLKIEKDFDEVIEIANNSSSLLNRLLETGTLDKKIADDHGVVGVAGRALGKKVDARIDFPYAAYNKVKFQAASEETGDVNARFRIRIKEVKSSMKILEQALKNLSESEKICSTDPVSLKKNFYSIGISEGWRGDIVYLVATDQNGEISRVDVRDPSFLNWTVLGHAGKGNVVPDFPLINKSFNLSYSGNDL
jgi:Ni,Fe-hydrogenase III large subunit/Ni,Fe-hydrogenase III component G